MSKLAQALAEAYDEEWPDPPNRIWQVQFLQQAERLLSFSAKLGYTLKLEKLDE